MKYLLDTAAVSDYFRRVGATHERVQSQPPHALAISAITEHEIRFDLLDIPPAVYNRSANAPIAPDEIAKRRPKVAAKVRKLFRLLDDRLEEFRLRNDAHRAIAQLLIRLGNGKNRLPIDVQVPRFQHPAGQRIQKLAKAHLPQRIHARGH